MRYWLLKTEPQEYSISLLRSEGRTRWEGIRNYQARNYLREMENGDLGFLYHSSCKTPGIYGTLKISGSAYPDNSALDSKSKYFDKKSKNGANNWSAIDVTFLAQYSKPLLLPDIKSLKELGSCPLTSRGNRLSVIPLTLEQFELMNEAASSQKE